MAYRKIDIDAFDEDQFLEDDELAFAVPSSGEGEEGSSAPAKANVTNVDYKGPRAPADVERAVDAAVSEAKSQLNKGNLSAALLRLLEDPPAGRDPQNAKDKNLKAVMDVLSSAKASDIPNIVKSFPRETIDVLMKYIYRGMSVPEQYQSMYLLQWHEKVFEIGGVGSIVRVLADRRAV